MQWCVPMQLETLQPSARTAEIKALRAAAKAERLITLEIALDPEQRADHKATERLLTRLQKFHRPDEVRNVA